MQTYTELQSELTSRLQVASNSTLFTTTRIQTLIKDAYLWATSLHLWPQLERGRITSTKANQYYYDYPEDFRTDSIVRVYIDAERYKRKAFEDFLDYKDDNPTDTSTYIFADYGRQVFIFPTPTVDGSSNFDIWGTIQPTQLSSGSDTTIFSSHDDSGNEAIVKKALSVAMARNDKGQAQKEEEEAIRMLNVIWDKVSKRQQRDQRLEHPMFDVPDYFSRGTGSAGVGKFSYSP